MLEDALQPHVSIIRGGGGPDQRERSLASGSNVYHTLRQRHNVVDVHLTPEGTYELQGRAVPLSDILSLGGVVFSTLAASEARRLETACRAQQVPCVSNAHTIYGGSSAMERRDILRKSGVKTIPYWRLAANYDGAEDHLYGEILEQLRYPVVISPLPDTFSADALVVRNEAELMEVLDRCFDLEAPTAVSDTYQGNLYTVLVMGKFRGEAPYAFPARELLHDHDVANTYDQSTADYRTTPEAPTDVIALAKSAFNELHLRNLAQVTILKTPDDELYVLDVDPHPSIDRHSLLFEVASDVGATLEEVFTLTVKDARRRAGKLKNTANQL
jgi:D-alanine-D-alanine ligase-like ATP-grasp enzyme